MREVVANLHMHTPYSDGAGYHREIAAAAAQAGLDAIITTDHNVHVRGIEGYHSGVLVLVGEEVHDARRRPQANHCLIFGADDELSQYAYRPQALIDAAVARGGMAFPAHPVEFPSGMSIENEEYGWKDWSIRGFAGLELWNYMSEFKARLHDWPRAALLAFFPSLAIRGPFRETLKIWDELLAKGKPVVAIGNSDAHAVAFHLGPITRIIFPYEYLFRCVNTHVLIDLPFSGDLVTDKRLLLGALRAGHCFVGYDLAGATRGFRFEAVDATHKHMMGDEFRRSGVVRYGVTCPASASIRLLRNGKIVAQANGETLEHQSVDPGVYRVEVYRRFRGLWRGWIFSNPIYVK